ncbi:hypothetical protein Cgig2_005109 [Carnegiea gigantea]|uniref:Uncharacterized protein n=1 Tax=Carnegiea gigantea TaxID=171969 RepID=A0A9Q1QRK7_9CARY|nr:hypothetical protein Cgig2_005109 [Carnegiea gigantea]
MYYETNCGRPGNAIEERYQGGERSVEEVLDRFCAQSEWSALFPAAKVFHIDNDFSDHLPILIRCFEPRRARRRARRLRGWEPVIGANEVEVCMDKLDLCMRELQLWNRHEFGNVQSELRKCKEELLGATRPGRRREILAAIRDWQKKEEILWWQRSRVNYLQHGDRNTVPSTSK